CAPSSNSACLIEPRTYGVSPSMSVHLKSAVVDRVGHRRGVSVDDDRRIQMGIGGSIAMLVIGAILAFAVKDTDLGGWLDINVVGWVLILAGLAGLVITLWVWNSRRRRV